MQLLETIRYAQGSFSNLSLHQNRMNNSRKVLFNCSDKITLLQELNSLTDKLKKKMLYKCRIEYDDCINKIEFIPYNLPNITSLRLISSNNIEYNYKYLARENIEELYAQKGIADDIIIIKNGLITDSSIANLLFFNGKQWITPASPLLMGTQRADLLNREQIITAQIQLDDMHNFSKIRLINAMMKFEDEVDVLMDNVY